MKLRASLILVRTFALLGCLVALVPGCCWKKNRCYRGTCCPATYCETEPSTPTPYEIEPLEPTAHEAELVEVEELLDESEEPKGTTQHIDKEFLDDTEL